MTSLAYLTTQQKWTQTIESVYIGVILLNTVILLTICFSVFIINIVKFVIKCRKKSQIENDIVEVPQGLTSTINNSSVITNFRLRPERSIISARGKTVAFRYQFLVILIL